MVHFSPYHYPSLKEYTAIIRMELMKSHLRRKLSDRVILTGQELGLSNEEIDKIMDSCYEDLIKVYN